MKVPLYNRQTTRTTGTGAAQLSVQASPGALSQAAQATARLGEAGQTASLNLNTAQDHKVTASGSVHITTINGSEGGSHTLRIINNGTATVGFSTNFLWPSGSTPSLPTADKAVSFISFTVNKVGVGTQLLSGASLNYS